MKPFYLNTKLPELFMDEELTTRFYLPFNTACVLLLVEKKMQKPIWITTDLLEITRKEAYLEKSNLPRIEFLTENGIIPHFTSEHFKNWLDVTISDGKEIQGTFSNSEYGSEFINIRDRYTPYFLPLFKKNKQLSHVLFYLSDKNVSLSNSFKQITQLQEELASQRKAIRKLFEINKTPLLEVNSNLKIEFFNEGMENLFPKLRENRKINFLEIWNNRNHRKLLEVLNRTKITQEEELILFEDLEDSMKKLKIQVKKLSLSGSSEDTFLLAVENLNEENDKEKELTKKAFLLQITQMISSELEENEETFISKASGYILRNFGINGIYYLDLTQTSKEKKIILFPKNQQETIPYQIYQSHVSNFSPIIKRSVKQINTNKVFSPGTELNSAFRKSPYLLGAPVYEDNKQIGVMVYMSETKKIDLDTVYQLYSFTTIFFKFYKYRTLISQQKAALL